MFIRQALDSDIDDVLKVERAAFGQDEEAELVRDLLADPSAEPRLSLLAYEKDKAVGHILFTASHLKDANKAVTSVILAPLAVVPEVQKRGIGGKLIEQGLKQLTESGIDLVFVLGHPEYYPRYGFEPAGQLGFEAPFPIPEKDAAAWMVQELKPDIIGSVSGKIICADAMNKPEYWRE